jgi:predicted DNA-binding protein
MEKSTSIGSYRLPPSLKEKVVNLADKENRSFNNMLQELLKRGLDKQLAT